MESRPTPGSPTACRTSSSRRSGSPRAKARSCSNAPSARSSMRSWASAKPPHAGVSCCSPTSAKPARPRAETATTASTRRKPSTAAFPHRWRCPTAYRTGQRFGVGYLIDVLQGKDNERACRNDHDKLSVWGIGKDTDATVWRSLFRQLTALGLSRLRRRGPRHGPAHREGAPRTPRRRDVSAAPRPGTREEGQDIQKCRRVSREGRSLRPPALRRAPRPPSQPRDRREAAALRHLPRQDIGGTRHQPPRQRRRPARHHGPRREQDQTLRQGHPRKRSRTSAPTPASTVA